MDFMSDALADGRKLRVFTVLDTFMRECVALEVSGSFRGVDVARVLTRAGVQPGLPRHFDQWAYANHVKLDFSRPK